MKNSTQMNGESTWKKNEEKGHSGKEMISGKEMGKNTSSQIKGDSMKDSSRKDGQSQWKQNEEGKSMSQSSSRQGSNEGTERGYDQKETTRSSDTIDKKYNK